MAFSVLGLRARASSTAWRKPIDSCTGVNPSTPPSRATVGVPSCGMEAEVSLGRGNGGAGGSGTCAEALRATSNVGSVSGQGRIGRTSGLQDEGKGERCLRRRGEPRTARGKGMGACNAQRGNQLQPQR